MITYRTNWMGPVNAQWIEEHGKHWAGGRIDIYGVPNEDYPLEYNLPMMHVEDWNSLRGWLDGFATKSLWSFDDLIAQYEHDVNTKIRWLKEKNT